MDDKLYIVSTMIYICTGCYRKYKKNDDYLLPRTVYFTEIFNFVYKFWKE